MLKACFFFFLVYWDFLDNYGDERALMVGETARFSGIMEFFWWNLDNVWRLVC